MLARLAGPLALVVLLAPFAAGALPPPVVTDTNAQIVSGHALHNYIAQHSCSSHDPVIGIASTDLTSRLAHASDGGSTAFTLHLDAIPGDDQCPAIDLEFTVPFAYPGSPQGSYAGFTATCGATGTFGIYEYPSGTSFHLYLSTPNGECGLPAGFHVGGFSVSNAVAGPALACSPLVVPACAGVYEYEPQHYNDCDGQPSSTTVTVVLDVVYAQRRCQPWSDGREHVIVQDSFGFVTIDATDDSCTIRDGLLGAVDQPCPEEVRRALYDTDWGHVLS